MSKKKEHRYPRRWVYKDRGAVNWEYAEVRSPGENYFVKYRRNPQPERASGDGKAESRAEKFARNGAWIEVFDHHKPEPVRRYPRRFRCKDGSVSPCVVRSPGAMAIWLNEDGVEMGMSGWVDEKKADDMLAKGSWIETFDHHKVRYPRRFDKPSGWPDSGRLFAEVCEPGGSIWWVMKNGAVVEWGEKEAVADGCVASGGWIEMFDHHKPEPPRDDKLTRTFVGSLVSAMQRSRS